MPISIVIAGSDEVWDERKQEFRPPTDSIKLTLEHSLVSLSLWEEKWHKSYIDTKDKTDEEIIDKV